MAADIAIVSFEPFLSGNESERRQVATEVFDAFSTVGWVYIKDHGIPQSRVDEIFELAKEFFALPLDQKLEYSLVDAELNQGYTADGAVSMLAITLYAMTVVDRWSNTQEANGGVDHKECYEHRRFANPCCPPQDVLPDFKEKLDGFYGQCLELGLNVLRCLAISMQLGDTFFDSITIHADPQLRVLHYPEIERKVVEQEGHARIIPHTDFGLCTLLFQDSVGGLEVDPFHTGEYKPATPIPGTVLINIADLLQRLTNDRCKSTRHRVVSPRTESDVLPARFSIPFFIHPDPETTIDPITLSPDEQKHFEPINAGKWRTWNTTKNYGLDTGSANFDFAVAA